MATPDLYVPIHIQYACALKLEERVEELEEVRNLLLQGWAKRKGEYQQELELQQLRKELEQAEHWLNKYECVLTAEEYGVRIRTQILLKRVT